MAAFAIMQARKENNMSTVMHKPTTTVTLSKQQILLLIVLAALIILAVAGVSLYTFSHISLLHSSLADGPSIVFGGQ
jgi:hypothetical protein